ncbi:MAG: hypothetical protein AB7O59_13905 [Pirellulales bacterium]
MARTWREKKTQLDQHRSNIEALPQTIEQLRAQIGHGGRCSYLHKQHLAKAEQDLKTIPAEIRRLKEELRELEQEYKKAGYEEIGYTTWTPGETLVSGRTIGEVADVLQHTGSFARPTPTGIEFDLALAGLSALKVGKAVSQRAANFAKRRAARSTVSPGDVDQFMATVPRKPTPTRTAANQYEIKHTGEYNYTVSGGGEVFDIDGYRGQTILEAKHVGKPLESPYVLGSSCPDPVRNEIAAGVRDELRRVRIIIESEETPFKSVEIITNSEEAKAYFEGLLREMQVPGTVQLRP